MTIQNVTQSSSFHQATQAATQQNQVDMGRFNGKNAQVANSPSSLLADAAEEMTFMLAETQSKKLAERKNKPRATDRMSERIKVYQKIQEQQTDNQPKADNQQRFIEQCKQQQPLTEEWLEQQQQSFSDPADYYLALEAVLSNDGLEPEMRAELESAQSRVAEKALNSMDACIHAVEIGQGSEFQSLGEDLQKAQAYHQTLFDFESVSKVLSDTAQRFGLDNLDQGLEFLLRTLGAHINNETLSQDKVALQTRISDLGNIKLLGQLYLGDARVLDRLTQVHGAPQSQITAAKLTERMIAMYDKSFIGMSDAELVLKNLSFPDTETEVLFVQDVFQMVKQLPVALFASNERRDQVVEAFQYVLDDAIDREEQELGF